MNAQDFLDHALGKLEGLELQQLNAELEADTDRRESLRRLTRRIDELLDDGEPDMPEGLGTRALALVARSRGSARRRSLDNFLPASLPFRWADVAVAASIFVAGVLTLIPAARRTQEQAASLGCVFNLQQLGVGLAQYAGFHQAFPHVGPDSQLAEAGVVPVLLHDQGLLNDRNLLLCPGNHHGGPRAQPNDGVVPDRATLSDARAHDAARYSRLISTDYAFHAGYRCKTTGKVLALSCRAPGMHPLMADQPSHDGRSLILPGNSMNHRGRGQNVLFVNGSVGWHTSRRIGPHDADLFLNAQLKPAPGINADDAALVPYFCPINGH